MTPLLCFRIGLPFGSKDAVEYGQDIKASMGLVV